MLVGCYQDIRGTTVRLYEDFLKSMDSNETLRQLKEQIIDIS
jgi:hypothetical protein